MAVASNEEREPMESLDDRTIGLIGSACWIAGIACMVGGIGEWAWVPIAVGATFFGYRDGRKAR
jgi:hypothetical protein